MDLLKCEICKDFYKSPLCLPCMHSFCSLCIRSSKILNCPCCTLKFSGITACKKNFLLEEIVLKYSALKTDCSTQTDNVVETRVQDLISSDLGRVCEDDEQNDNDLYVDLDPPTRPSESKSDDGTCLCPVCSKTVATKNINIHLDSNCKSFIYHDTKAAVHISKKRAISTPQPAVRVKQTAKVDTRSYKPSIAYDITKDKKLRDILKDLGLPTHGDRKLLIRRHQEYVNLYNSNLDSSHPISDRELMRQFNRDFVEQAREQYTSTKNVDVKKHLDKNKDQFAELIMQIKERKRKAKENVEVSETTDRD